MSAEAKKPYIGVTGITSSKEAETIAQAFKENLPKEKTHQGMAGYIISHRMLGREKEHDSKYPQLQNLAGLLEITTNSALNTIHYNTDEKNTLAEQVEKLLSLDNIYGANLCRAIQFNIRWPDPDQLKAIKDKFANLEFIITLSGRILRRSLATEIEKRLLNYNNLVDYILIDPSGGKGLSFEEEYIQPYYRLVKSLFPETPVILAGGFDDENVLQRIYRISRRLQTRDFGIDAEYNLKEKENPPNTSNQLSPEKTKQYIRQASDFLAR